ncbi:MAG: hypothetical protein IPO97_10605 [Sphingomonadales bacterium]|nr:hypothetical protein [Sphingomonadales bacterium]
MPAKLSVSAGSARRRAAWWGVAVMAAGVHLTRTRSKRKGRPVVSKDRQRVRVGAQADPLVAVVVPRSSPTTPVPPTPHLQVILQVSMRSATMALGAGFLEADFRMRMNIAADRHEIVLEILGSGR